MAKRITTHNEEQGWLDSFNGYCNTDYKMGEVISGDMSELLNQIDEFNNVIACGPAIQLIEQE